MGTNEASTPKQLGTIEKAFNLLSPEEKFWVSNKDSVMRNIYQTPDRVTAYGTIEVDFEKDFGVQLGRVNRDDAVLCMTSLIDFNHFCVRSSLMQSLQEVTFGDYRYIGNGKFVIETRLDSLNRVPVKLTEDIAVGRFYYPKAQIFGEEIPGIALSVSKDRDLKIITSAQDKSGAIYGEQPYDISSGKYTQLPVAFTLPVDTFYLHTTREIDLDAISKLNRSNRDLLAKYLGLRPVTREELQMEISRRGSLYYLGQTREKITVPKGFILRINLGYDDHTGIHLASPLFDQGYEGYGRIEARSLLPSQVFDSVEFGAFKI
ncbi:MAG: hypothetical protein WCO33_02920 [bacterium]